MATQLASRPWPCPTTATHWTHLKLAAATWKSWKVAITSPRACCYHMNFLHDLYVSTKSCSSSSVRMSVSPAHDHLYGLCGLIRLKRKCSPPNSVVYDVPFSFFSKMPTTWVGAPFSQPPGSIPTQCGAPQ